MTLRFGPKTEAGARLMAALGGEHACDSTGEPVWDSILAIEAEAITLSTYSGRSAGPVTWDFLETHWPDFGAAGDDSTWLVCRCGWDSQDSKLDWIDHLRAAAQEANREPAA